MALIESASPSPSAYKIYSNTNAIDSLEILFLTWKNLFYENHIGDKKIIRPTL